MSCSAAPSVVVRAFAGVSHDVLGQYPTTAAVFLPHGRPPAVGDVLVQHDLARSLETIARDRLDLMKEGETIYRISPALPDPSRMRRNP